MCALQGKFPRHRQPGKAAPTNIKSKVSMGLKWAHPSKRALHPGKVIQNQCLKKRFSLWVFKSTLLYGKNMGYISIKFFNGKKS